MKRLNKSLIMNKKNTKPEKKSSKKSSALTIMITMTAMMKMKPKASQCHFRKENYIDG